MRLRWFACLFALALALPSLALAGDPFTEGKQLLDSGNYAAAVDKLQQAFAADPENLDISFHLGRAAFESGDYEGAVAAFERILIVKPDAPRVKLELARAYARLGSREIARQYFREVQKTNPPEMVWRNIQAQLEAIDASEQRHFFNGFVTLGYFYDDNVGVFPKADTVFLGGLPFQLDGEQEGDSGLQATAVVNHLYRFLDTEYAWKSTLYTYNNLYEDLDDFNLNSYGVTTGLLQQSDGNLWEIQAQAAQADIDYDRYFGMLGLNASYSWRLSNFVYLNLGAAIQDKTYYQDGDMDAVTWGVSVNPVLNYGDNRLSLFVSREDENADDDLFSYERVTAGLRYDRRLPYDFAAYGSFRYQETDYEDEQPLFGRERSDEQTTLEAGVSKTLWRSEDHRRSLAVQVSYTHTSTDSNIPLYEYDKDVALTSFTFAF